MIILQYKISIHALREESDAQKTPILIQASISIHALREESDFGLWTQALQFNLWISIHALREESDTITKVLQNG